MKKRLSKEHRRRYMAILAKHEKAIRNGYVDLWWKDRVIFKAEDQKTSECRMISDLRHDLGLN